MTATTVGAATHPGPAVEDPAVVGVVRAHADGGNLWRALGLMSTRPEVSVLHAYRRGDGTADPVARRAAAKILTDPWYRTVYERDPTAAGILSAGWFDDGLEPGEERRGLSLDARLATTPVGKVRANLGRTRGARTGRPLVLLLTGGLSPVHDGHLAALAGARRVLEEAGRTVVGGYLAPDHDSYVDTKRGGAAAMHHEDRIAACQRAVADSDWLDVDPWAARYAGRAVNFTDVLDRLDAYLRVHAGRNGPPVEVALVVGSDNAGFARVMEGRGTVVVVERDGPRDPGSSATPTTARPGVLRVPAGEHAHASSTRVRETAGAPVPDPVPSGPYAVRADLVPSTASWDRAGLSGALAAFSEDLHAAIAGAFARAGAHVDTLSPGPAVQEAVLTAVAARSGVVCLDATTCPVDAGPVDGVHPFGVSRLFEASGAQERAVGVVARPGWPSLADQAATVPAGRYVLVDDDVSTGTTVAAVRRILAHVDLTEVVELCPFPAAGLVDLVDAKDFLVGAAGSGLVVGLADGSHGRAPYLLPYVTPRTRARIPAREQTRFSVDVWEANARFHDRLDGTPLTVADADPAVRALLVENGFSGADTLGDVARWHADRLTVLPFPGAPAD